MTKLTKKEQQLINGLIDFGPETIRGIKLTGIEVALLDLCRGASAMGQWDTLKTAYHALLKLNPKAETFFQIV